MLSRRHVLSGVAITGAAAACGACAQTPTGVTLSPAVIDAITKITAGTCNALPTVTTLIAIVAAGFPALNGVATVTAAVAQEIAKIFCQQVGTQPATQGGSLTAMVNGAAVELHGFHLKDGKLVEF